MWTLMCRPFFHSWTDSVPRFNPLLHSYGRLVFYGRIISSDILGGSSKSTILNGISEGLFSAPYDACVLLSA